MGQTRMVGASVVALLAVLGVSCSSSQGGEAGPDETGGAGGWSCSSMGESCQCADGRRGTQDCVDGGVVVCNCDTCPQVQFGTAPSFDACGGEPFGTWVMENAEALDADITVRSLLTGEVLGTCPSHSELIDMASAEIRLRLADGGDLELYNSSYGGTLWYEENCIQQSMGTSCDQTNWSDFSCTSECGLCRCPTSVSEAADTGTWTRTDHSLQLDFGRDQVTYDYCVTGDQLQLVRDGLSVVFQRAYTLSLPTSCDTRTVDTCVKGCTVGRCVGGTSCDSASTEPDCTNRQTCQWDTGTCFGTPRPCELGDFGTVPGCDFVDTQPTCAGVREPCTTTPLDLCATAPGCGVTAGCIGGRVYCGSLYGACSLCDDVPGCSYCASGSAACFGETTCEALTSSYACDSATRYRMGTCQWVDSLCLGDAIPCDELTPEMCGSAPGCSIVF